jgi:hypothetical protein
LWLSPHPWDAPVNGYMEANAWVNVPIFPCYAVML